MPKTEDASLVSRLAFLFGGVAALFLVGFLIWVGFIAPLNSRQPVPSPGGEYFAYFSLTEEDDPGNAGLELIIAEPKGKLLGRLRIHPGKISWSNANHLVVVDETGNQATLIANAEERFLVLARIPRRPGAEPRWAPDGNKLATFRRSESGLQLAIYDVQQPQAFPVPLPADFHLNRPWLLAWSPGSEYLYFTDIEGREAVLWRVEVRAGSVQAVVRGISPRAQRPPQMAPDGTKIFVDLPPGTVIDAQTGGLLWTLPPKAEALWWAWSADSRGLLYFRQEDPTKILVHDFTSSSDQVAISGVRPNGFFAPSGNTYFFRDPSWWKNAARRPLGDWRSDSWGWYQVDRRGPTAEDLGRVELWPWERTLEGLILARQDVYTRVQFGLYNPESKALERYTFPTEREDLTSQVISYRLVLATVAVYAILAAIIFIRRSGSPSVRAFYILSFLVMALVCGQLMGSPDSSQGMHSPYPMELEEMGALGWSMSVALPQLVFTQVRWALAALWALLPLAALHFGLVFPDHGRRFGRNRWVRLGLYGIALPPVVATVLGRLVPGFPHYVVRGLLWICGAAVVVVWMMNLQANSRRPVDKRAREQVRWMVLSLVLLAEGIIIFLILRQWEDNIVMESSRRLFHTLHSSLFALLSWVTPAAVAYSVAAQRPGSVRLFLRRAFRQVLMGVPALLLFLAAWGGAGLVMRGSPWAFSAPAIIVAVLLTIVAVLPLRGRLRLAADRAFDRERFESRERLSDFARGLPHALDCETLAKRLEEVLPQAIGARWSLLFVADRSARKLRFQPGKTNRPTDAKLVEFELHEPLCELLWKDARPFEPSVAAHDPELRGVLESAGERLRKLQAEVVLGLRRNELLGLLVMGPKISGELYDQEQLDLLSLVAREVAAAIENIELFEVMARNREMRKELQDATEIQEKLFPTAVPRLNSAKLVGRCFPARAAGGDYYDFLELPGRKVGLAMSDVSGKGMRATLLMASVEGFLRRHASTASSLTDLVRGINHQLFTSSREAEFCSLFYGAYDDTSRRLEYVNAGHVPPLLLTAGSVQFLEPTGLPLGLFPEISHRPRLEILEPGAILLIYSDGVMETSNGRAETFGRERLIAAVARARESDAERLLAQVLADIRDFESGVPLDDDQTLVLLKLNPE